MNLETRNKKQFDVIIVGAGPAGSTAAYHLDESLDVLIVDKSAFPRHKACGGALVGCLDWSSEFDNYAEIEHALERQPNEHLHLYVDREPWWEHRGTHFFDQVHRYHFDDLMLQAALRRSNVSFREFRATSVTSLKDGRIQLADGKDVLEAQVAIGADGVSSIVSKALGNPVRDANHAGACCEYHIECEKQHDKTYVFYLWNEELGYVWLFSTIDGYYLGAGYIGEARKRVKAHLNESLDFCIKQGFIPKEHKIKRTFGGLAPTTVVKHLASERVLLVGDAAGFLHQLSGEGIYYAMKSGQIAGWILSKSFDDIAARYHRAVRHVAAEVTYLKTIRPRLFHSALNSYFLGTQYAERWGLASHIKAPFINRFCKRTNLPENSHYRKLSGAVKR